MKSGQYTIRELFCEGDIGYFCVPEIQRDYVWDEEQVRPFVESILKSLPRRQFSLPDGIPEKDQQSFLEYLSQTNRQNIGFIYAYFDQSMPERYYLIDGQQRLTTLYLLLAVLATKSEKTRTAFLSRYFRLIDSGKRTGHLVKPPDFRSYQLKIDYKVREISHLVLQHLVADLTSTGQNSGKYVKQLLSGGWCWDNDVRPVWWQQRFASDTTVKSLFRNTSLIAQVLAENASAIDNQYFNVFAGVEDGVEVWYFDTAHSQQGEELYIYMNSRGEQLSYNENRRAACIALCKTQEEKQTRGNQWDDELQNWFWKQRGKNRSADKGLDLFLHTVEMITLTLSETSAIKATTWKSFLEQGDCPASPITSSMVDDYFAYQAGIKFHDGFQAGINLLDGFQIEQSNIFSNFLQGAKWNSQINAIPILVCLELLKGFDGNDRDELNTAFTDCLLFFKNLRRHEDVEKSPSDYIKDFLLLARICRENRLDLFSLIGRKNSLLTDEETWRLKLLKSRKEKFGSLDMTQTLQLLDEMSSSTTLLHGQISILFAVAFTGNENTQLAMCSSINFEELSTALRDAKVKFQHHFSAQQIQETARMMLLYGDTDKRMGQGLWYPCALGIKKDVKSLNTNWHNRLTTPRTSPLTGIEYTRVNGAIVDFLKNDGKEPSHNNVLSVPVEYEILQQIAASQEAWKHLVYAMETRADDDRFRPENDHPWKPEFKGQNGTNLLWFLSKEIRQGTVSSNGRRLGIDYDRQDNGVLKIQLCILNGDGLPSLSPEKTMEIGFCQTGDWEQTELNNLIRHFRNTGEFPSREGSEGDEL